MNLILYSKPGCHLCEGLQEKLEAIVSFPIALEVRDISSRDDWLQQYQYEIPVLYLVQQREGTEILTRLPRVSPRASLRQVEQLLEQFI